MIKGELWVRIQNMEVVNKSEDSRDLEMKFKLIKMSGVF